MRTDANVDQLSQQFPDKPVKSSVQKLSGETILWYSDVWIQTISKYLGGKPVNKQFQRCLYERC